MEGVVGSHHQCRGHNHYQHDRFQTAVKLNICQEGWAVSLTKPPHIEVNCFILTVNVKDGKEAYINVCSFKFVG
jgi:hypothetical protein